MSEAHRIPLIDHLRGIAALSVAWFHMTGGYDSWVRLTGSGGWLGVEAFFVISGFVIPYALGSGKHPYRLQSFPTFVARRLVRLEPPYLASIVLVVGLNFLASTVPYFRGPPPTIEQLQLAAHLFYLVPLTSYDWIQPVYWTLAFEFVFYLVIGLIFPFIGNEQQKWQARLLAVAVVTLAGLGVISHLLALFVMGFIVFRRLSVHDGLGWTVFLLGACVAAMAIRGAIDAAIVGALTALVILFHRSIPTIGGRAGAMLTGLGTISYSLYLVHAPIGGKVVNLGQRFVEGGAAEFCLSLLALAASLLAAALFWQLIERPSALAGRRVHLGIRPVVAVRPET